jgi:ABC-type nitrate/sulfonate/bicarbonate transport system substrate-binding protein
LDVRFLEPATREVRLARLRSGATDVGLLDLASLVDTVATDPSFGARCVFVLGQHLPMAAIFVRDRPAPTHPIQSPADLVRARYGGEHGSTFVAEHRALLRRLGGEEADLHVAMGYSDLFGALATGSIDVAPDYAGIGTTYQRALRRGEQIGVLPYRECGVRAYGTGFAASRAALRDLRNSVALFVSIAAEAYERMRADPEDVIESASSMLPDIDRSYALQEWIGEEEGVLFTEEGLGTSRPEVWDKTVAWRQEVAGFSATPAAGDLAAPLSPDDYLSSSG